VVTIRILLAGEQSMASSDAAFDEGDLREAILFARQAATQTAPGAPHVTAAYTRLTAVAVGAEAQGRPEIADLAWNAIRGAALESRHVWVERSEELALANRNLARLAAAKAAESDRRTAREESQRVLSRDEGPRVPWIALLALGLGLTTTGLAMIVLRGLRPDGRVVPGPFRWAVLLALAGTACWIVAVSRA
jgi:hypothetical protein